MGRRQPKRAARPKIPQQILRELREIQARDKKLELPPSLPPRPRVMLARRWDIKRGVYLASGEITEAEADRRASEFEVMERRCFAEFEEEKARRAAEWEAKKARLLEDSKALCNRIAELYCIPADWPAKLKQILIEQVPAFGGSMTPWALMGAFCKAERRRQKIAADRNMPPSAVTDVDAVRGTNIKREDISRARNPRKNPLWRVFKFISDLQGEETALTAFEKMSDAVAK